MQLDWLTLVAQVVNFLILLVLLHRFLYRPIMAVMADREREIAGRLEEAETAKERAESALSEAEEERRRLDERRRKLLDEARREADKQREKLLEEARREVDDRRDRWRRTLEREQRKQAAELERRIAALVSRSLRQAVESLASEKLAHAVERTFLERLRDLDDHRRAEIRDAAAGDAGAAVIRTAAEPEQARRERLEEAVRGLVGDDVEIRFERDRELIDGVELAVGDHRLAWSLRDYLESLDNAVASRLRETADRRPSASGADDGGEASS